MHTCMCIYIYACVYIYIERERGVYMYIHIVDTYVNIQSIPFTSAHQRDRGLLEGARLGSCQAGLPVTRSFGKKLIVTELALL